MEQAHHNARKENLWFFCKRERVAKGRRYKLKKKSFVGQPPYTTVRYCNRWSNNWTRICTLSHVFKTMMLPMHGSCLRCGLWPASSMTRATQKKIFACRSQMCHIYVCPGTTPGTKPCWNHCKTNGRTLRSWGEIQTAVVDVTQWWATANQRQPESENADFCFASSTESMFV